MLELLAFCTFQLSAQCPHMLYLSLGLNIQLVPAIALCL
jgi:hypothetical protein